jgi:hypothetical protein
LAATVLHLARRRARTYNGHNGATIIFTEDTVTTPSPWDDPDQLDAMLEHIAYERDMLTDALKEYAAHPALNLFAHNVLIEVSSIHARTLYFFLFSEPKRGEGSRSKFDAWAGDYFMDCQDWIKLRGCPNARLSSLVSLAGKFLAHPSYKRLSEPKPNVQLLTDAAHEIARLLNEFETNADKTGITKARFASSAKHAWPQESMGFGDRNGP